MKILIVGPPAFGYTKYIYDALIKNNTLYVDFVYIDKSKFKYKNFAHKARNFVLKTFFNKNLKIEFQDQIVLNSLNSVKEWDQVFIIRPDLLKDKTLLEIKSKAKKLITFYYDSTRRFSRKKNIINFFDEVYSYDKLDIKKYNLKFLTNYIFAESHHKDYEYLFFNISSHDLRFEKINRISAYIKSKNWSSKVIVFHPTLKGVTFSEFLTIDSKHRTVSEVSSMIQKSKIIFEVQREDQVGLSFRIFEALGHCKKIITTNSDIVNYDFYNPQNILVVDINNLNIPDEFVNSPYAIIDDSILKKYRIDNWVKEVFKV